MEQRYDLIKRIADAVSVEPTPAEGEMEKEYDLLKRVAEALEGGVRRTRRGPVTAATDLVGATDDIVTYDATARAIAVTLPDAALYENKSRTLKKVAGAFAVTVQSAGSLVEGASSYVLLLGEAVEFNSNGTDWEAF